jgi:hypothetical protein
MRPVSPNWDVLWSIDAAKTQALIYGMASRHIDGGLATTSGLFDRHSEANTITNELPFLEAGGVLIETLTWLGAKLRSLGTPDTALDTAAKKVATFLYNTRDLTTGLLRNQGNEAVRWNYTDATSEVGWWAINMLKAYQRTADPDYLTWAVNGVKAFLNYAWDATNRRYFGRVLVATRAQSYDSTTYTPGFFSRAWDSFFPKHDYLIELGIACLELHAVSPDAAFPTAAQRIAAIIREQRPSVFMGSRSTVENRDGFGLTTAESFGRAIKLYLRMDQVLGGTAYRVDAERVAHEAYLRLWHPASGMFRGHTHYLENRYDSVDRTGVLCDALLDLGPFTAITTPALIAYYPVVSGSAADSIGYAGMTASAMSAGAGTTLATTANTGPDRGGGSFIFTGVTCDAATLAAAVAANDYFEITLTPGAQPLNLSHLTFLLGRSQVDNAPKGFAIRSSIDGFTANLVDEYYDLAASGVFLQMAVSLHGGGFTGLTAPVTFRFYA